MKVKKTISALLIIALITNLLPYAPKAYANSNTYISFARDSFTSPDSMLNLQGNTSITGGKLQLTPPSGSKTGSAFLNSKIKQSNGFSTMFQFTLPNQSGTTNGADGLMFIISSSANQYGRQGGGMGFTGISNSVGIEFDTFKNSSSSYENSSSHIAVDVNGQDITSTAPLAYTMLSGNYFHTSPYTYYAWVDYDGVGKNLYVRINTSSIRPATPTLACTVDLAQYVGTEYYVGFTAATGGSYEEHSIVNWYLDNKYWSSGLNAGGGYTSDSTPPTAPILTPFGSNITIGGSTDSQSGIHHYEYKLSSEAAWNTGSTVELSSYTGSVSIQARAIDNAGNVSTVTQRVPLVIITGAATGITSSGVTFNGSAYGNNVTDTGFVYSTSNQNPVIGGTDCTTVSGASITGSFTATLTSVTGSAIYYVRAYATDASGSGYGDIVSFTAPAAGGGTPSPTVAIPTIPVTPTVSPAPDTPSVPSAPVIPVMPITSPTPTPSPAPAVTFTPRANATGKDTIPPVWVDGCPLVTEDPINLFMSSIGGGSTDVKVRLKTDEAATVYYVYVPLGSTLPSAQQIKEGKDSTGKALGKSSYGTIRLMAGISQEFVTAFKVSLGSQMCLVAEDAFGNLQKMPVSLPDNFLKNVTLKYENKTVITPLKNGNTYDNTIYSVSDKVELSLVKYFDAQQISVSVGGVAIPMNGNSITLSNLMNGQNKLTINVKGTSGTSMTYYLVVKKTVPSGSSSAISGCDYIGVSAGASSALSSNALATYGSSGSNKALSDTEYTITVPYYVQSVLVNAHTLKGEGTILAAGSTSSSFNVNLNKTGNTEVIFQALSKDKLKYTEYKLVFQKQENDLIDGAYYRLSTNDKLATLRVQDETVTVQEPLRKDHEIYQFNSTGDGRYYIVNKFTGLVLKSIDTSLSTGKQDYSEQCKFYVSGTDRNYNIYNNQGYLLNYRVNTNDSTKRDLQLEKSSAGSGSTAETWWDLEMINDPEVLNPAMKYGIMNSSLDAAAIVTDTSVQMADAGPGGKYTKFSFTYDENAGTWTIQDAISGKYLKADNNKGTVLMEASKSEAGVWQLKKMQQGTYQIKNGKIGAYLIMSQQTGKLSLSTVITDGNSEFRLWEQCSKMSVENITITSSLGNKLNFDKKQKTYYVDYMSSEKNFKLRVKTAKEYYSIITVNGKGYPNNTEIDLGTPVAEQKITVQIIAEDASTSESYTITLRPYQASTTDTTLKSVVANMYKGDVYKVNSPEPGDIAGILAILLGYIKENEFISYFWEQTQQKTLEVKKSSQPLELSSTDNRVSFLITPNNPNTKITVNGYPVQAGKETFKFSLNDPDTRKEAVIKVTSADGRSSSTYTVLLHKAADTDYHYLPTNNVDLFGVRMDTGDSSIMLEEQSQVVSNSVKQLKLTAFPADNNCTVTINGKSSPYTLNFTQDKAEVEIKVTSSYNTNFCMKDAISPINKTPQEATYHYTFIRASASTGGKKTASLEKDSINLMSTDNSFGNMQGLSAEVSDVRTAVEDTAPKLKSLETTLGLPYEQVGEENDLYTVSVPEGTTNLAVKATSAEPEDIILINGVQVVQNTYSREIPLTVGENWITIALSSADGSRKSTYRLLAGKVASTATGIKSILWGDQLRAEAGKENEVFTIKLPAGTNSTKLKVIPVNTEARVSFLGKELKDNTIIMSPLSGSNTYPITVTAVSGDEQQYFLKVVKPLPSSVAELAGLKVSYGGTLLKEVLTKTGEYLVQADDAKAGIRIIATAKNKNAALTVDGVSVANGKESDTIYVKNGQSKITLRVTAEDGTTYREYRINLSKEGKASLKPITFTDIKGTSYKKSIDLLSTRGIVKGSRNHKFQPEKTITKAQYCTMIARAFDLKVTGQYQGELSIRKKSAYYNAVRACFDAGIFSKEDAQTFRAGDKLTRGYAIETLGRLNAKVSPLTYPDWKTQKTILKKYMDASSLQEMTAVYTIMLSKEGILSGIAKGQIQPQKALTRGETADLLARMLKQLGLVL